jgi:hypothetical protein
MMAVYLPQFHDFQLRADAPRRPLDWRFQRAIALGRHAARKRCPEPGDDALVLRYADLLYRLGEHTTVREFAGIRKRHPDLAEVHLAYATMNKTELALFDGLLLSRSADPNLIREQSGLTARQQSLYRSMFLDIEGRRKMSIFIATQLMEPARLRNTALECDPNQNAGSSDQAMFHPENGSLPLRAQCTLRVIGFYSSPVVLELVYSGFLSGTIPAGRDSAVRFLTQTTLTNICRFGVIASGEVPFMKGGMIEVYKLASALAMTEKEDGQIDIIQNVEALFTQFRPRIGGASKILEMERLPREVFQGEYELTESEMVEAMQTGTLPDTIAELTETKDETS